MLSPAYKSTPVAMDRSSGYSSYIGSGKGSVNDGSYSGRQMEWSTQVPTRYPSPTMASPRPGASLESGGQMAGCLTSNGPRLRHGTIRVIHIFAPKIIKTDVSNFKQLVQKLTGNSSTSKRFGGSRGKGSKRGGGAKAITPSSSRGQQILSHYSNATQIFGSSNRVEYIIPRSPSSGISSKPYFSLTPAVASTSRPGMHFHRRNNFEEFLMDIKPVVTLRESPLIDYSHKSVSQQSCSSPFLRSHHNGDFRMNQQFKDSTNVLFAHGDELQQHGQRGVDGSCSSSPRQPLTTDPFQSLSGYKEKLSSPPPKSLTSNPSTFPMSDDRNQDQNSLLRTGSFCDMEILTGLVKPRPNDDLHDTPPTCSWSSSHQSNYSSDPASDFSFSPGHVNTTRNLCRFSVQSPLHGGVPQLSENF